MKYIVLLLFSSIFVSCNKSENVVNTTKNDLEKNSLKGKVNILEEKNFDAAEKFGKPVKLNFRDWSVITYDPLGNILEEKTMYENGEIISIKKFKYDNKNKILEENFVLGDNSDVAKYLYDVNDNNIELTYYRNGEIAIKHVNIFDSKHNLIDYRLYEYDGSLRFKILSKFNNKNLKIETENYYLNGNSFTISNKKTNKYDNKGNLIEEKSYDEKGNLNYTYKFVYDDKNNEIEKILSKDNIITKDKRNFDEFGNCIEGIEYSNDNFKSKFANNYKYDKKGNWIQRIHLTNDVVKSIVERKIKYYN